MTQLSPSITRRYGENFDSIGYLSEFFDDHILLPTPSAKQMIQYGIAFGALTIGNTVIFGNAAVAYFGREVVLGIPPNGMIGIRGGGELVIDLRFRPVCLKGSGIGNGTLRDAGGRGSWTAEAMAVSCCVVPQLFLQWRMAVQQKTGKAGISPWKISFPKAQVM